MGGQNSTRSTLFAEYFLVHKVCSYAAVAFNINTGHF